MWLVAKKYKNDVWQKAVDFEYEDHLDTIQFQKVCPWCGDAMIYEDFSLDLENSKISKFTWTIGFILPLDRGGNKKIDNLQAIHVHCELQKISDYTLAFGTD